VTHPAPRKKVRAIAHVQAVSIFPSNEFQIAILVSSAGIADGVANLFFLIMFRVIAGLLAKDHRFLAVFAGIASGLLTPRSHS
jgi:hypothetical protein